MNNILEEGLVGSNLPLIRTSEHSPEESQAVIRPANKDLPTIRSATNVPGHTQVTNILKEGSVASNLPIIRPSEHLPDESLPVIRSTTNTPESRVFSIKPFNRLRILASRMGV